MIGRTSGIPEAVESTKAHTARSRVTSALDAAASLGTAAAAGVLIWSLLKPVGPPPPPPPPPLPGEPIVTSGAPSKGVETAPVVMVQFIDFQCQYCERFHREVMPSIERDYVENGRVRVVFFHLPLSALHPLAELAAEASECAGEQGAFWAMHDAIFARPERLDTTALRSQATSIGLDLDRFNSCMKGHAPLDRIRAWVAEAAAWRVTGTPTFFLGYGVDGGRVRVVERLSGMQSAPGLKSVLDRLVAAAPGR